MLKTNCIKQLLEKEGRTRKWLASRCGISVGSLNHALNERRNLSLPVVMHIAIELGVKVEEISDYRSHSSMMEVKAAS